MDTLNKYEVPALCANACVNTALMNTKERELLLVAYANLLEANLKGNKTDSVMARFSFISLEEQLKNFEEEYPEVVSEYYLSHRP